MVPTDTPGIRELVESGSLEKVFLPLVPLFPQSLRYIDGDTLDEFWPVLLKGFKDLDPGIADGPRDEVIEQVMRRDPVMLASEIDSDPFKTLIRTILSARSKDDQTIKVSNRLFERYDTAEKLAAADPEDVKEIIRPIGFYNTKTRYVISTAKALLDRHGGRVPGNFKELVALPGVGAKVANCVLVYAFGIPAIPVDTHVHRIVNRWGLVDTRDPDATMKALEKILPRKWWLLVNDLLVRFGKEICLPVNPKCDVCPLFAMCPKLLEKTREKNHRGSRKKKKTGKIETRGRSG